MDNLVSYSDTNNALGQATGTSRSLRAIRCTGCIGGLPSNTVIGHAVRQLRYLVNYFSYETSSLITIGCHEDVRITQSDTHVPCNTDLRYSNRTGR